MRCKNCSSLIDGEGNCDYCKEIYLDDKAVNISMMISITLILATIVNMILLIINAITGDIDGLTVNMVVQVSVLVFTNLQSIWLRQHKRNVRRKRR